MYTILKTILGRFVISVPRHDCYESQGIFNANLIFQTLHCSFYHNREVR